MHLRDDGKIEIEITDAHLGELKEVVYIWQTEAGGLVRVGTSKKRPVVSRLQRYSGDIQRGLLGVTKNPSLEEAQKWRDLLKAGSLICYVHQPDEIDTIGPLRPYLDIERVLIATQKPILNRGTASSAARASSGSGRTCA
jgi:hypothetical protein